MSNPDIAMTLDESVKEVLGMLTGLDLTYEPEQDRYRAVTRQINRALRANALEREWSYYSSLEDIGTARVGEQDVAIRASIRPRIIGDDSVRLCDDNGSPRVWAYFLPRDAIEKYPARRGLWVSTTRQSLHFSRPFQSFEDGLHIQLPVMREPIMFRLPDQPENPDDPLVDVPDDIRNQLLDFEFPDVVLQRAAYFYAQTDPVMQPRAQTLEAEWKNTYYALNERDDRNTDSPFLNEFAVPIQSGINDTSYQDFRHPHADDRY
jgi:hypothetical protein